MPSQEKSLLARTWLVFAVAAVCCAGFLFPRVGLALPGYHVIDVGVVIVMFFGGLKLSKDAFTSALGRLPMLGMSLVLVFGLSPLLGLGLGEVLGFDGSQGRLAVLLCSAQATTLATAIVLTEVAGGDVALAMVLTIVNNLVSVLVTPLLFRVLAGSEVDVDQWAMTQELLLKIVAPVLVAQVARRWLAGFARRHGRKLSVVSQLIILVYVYAGVSAGQRHIAAAPGSVVTVLLLVASLHATLLLVSALVSRVVSSQPDERVAFTLCSAQKTLPAAMLLWKSHFPTLPLGPVVAVAYHMLQLVVDSLLAASFSRLPLIRRKDP